MDLTSHHPYWPLNSGLIRSYPALKTDLKCEVLVIGAGITGALCAYHLIKAGMDVAVLDKRDVASGSTSASIGKLAVLCDEIGDPCGFTWKSSAYLASREKDVPGLQAEYAARRAAGIDLDFLSRADVEARFSFSRPAALLSKVAAEVDVYQLTHRLLQCALESGGRIFDRTEVDFHELGANGVILTTASGAAVRAKWIVFATGHEVVEILKRDIVDLNSSFAFVSEPIEAFPGWWEKCLLWETARPYFYMRTTVDGRAIVGGEDASYRNPRRRDAALGKKSAKLEKRFREMFPAIDLQPAYAWAGTFGETKDGLAYIGSVPELPHCFFTLGFGGNGITYSVIAAEIVRDTIQGKQHPDAHLFRFDR